MTDQDSENWLAELVSHRTVSGEQNRDLMHALADWLEGLGANIRITPSAADRLNVLASFGGHSGGILVGGHLDVVPAPASNWDSDPFTLTRCGERLYARGTSDMKGFVANMLAIAPQLSASELTQPVHLLLTTDEEIGCLGVQAVIQELVMQGPRPDWALIGEPTDLQICTAHKGKVAYNVSVEGQTGHSSNPDGGLNAVDLAARLIVVLGDMGVVLRRYPAAAGHWIYPWDSIHVGQVEGGQALNVIAASCHFDFEIRYLPGTDVEALITRIQKKATVLERQASASGINARIHLHESSRYPGASVSVQSPAIRWLSSCLPEAQFEQADYGTEAGCLQAALGIDAIVCGPGNISRAHRPNEYITRQELAAGEKMLRRVLGLSVLDA